MSSDATYLERVCGKTDPSIEEAIAGLLRVRQEKEKRAKILAQLQAAEEAFERYLLRQLEENQLSRVSAHGVTIRPIYRLVPQAVDWEAVYDWARETGDLTIFQRRLAATRVAELADNDELPPGIKLTELASLSVRTNRRRFTEEEV